MGTITRVSKTGGGTDLNNGKLIKSAELNTDFNTIVTVINGQIDSNNINSSANIPNSSLLPIDDTHVDDSSSDEAAMAVTVTPGDTGSADSNRPTDLKGEIERLRYRLKANNGYFSNIQYMETGGSMATASWTEPPIVGRNLLPNPGFEVLSGASGTAPDGWSLVGTPGATAIESAAHAEAGIDKRSLRVLTDATTEGFSRVVTGLKPDTKYLVGLAYTLTTGGISVDTVNGLGSGDYQDIAIIDTTTGAGFVVKQAIVMTDSTPADITMRIFGTVTVSDFNLYYAWFYEMSDDAPIEIPHIPMQTAEWTNADQSQTNASTGAWVVKTALSLTQYVPYEGYRMIYEVTLSFASDASGSGTNSTFFAFRLSENLDAAGSNAVQGPFGYTNQEGGPVDTVFFGDIVNMKYVIENPTPGVSYEFTVEAWNEGTGTGFDSIIFNPTIAGLATQSSSRLYIERL